MFLNISYKDHLIKKEVCNHFDVYCNWIQASVGVHDDLLTMMKMRNLRWHSNLHVKDNSAEIIKEQGRKESRLGTGYSPNAAEDRERWRRCV